MSGCRSPSKHSRLSHLERIQSDHALGADGTNYSEEELEMEIWAKRQRIADRYPQRKFELEQKLSLLEEMQRLVEITWSGL
jgi:hypothetical protein